MTAAPSATREVGFLLGIHAVMLVLFDLLIAFADLRTSAVTFSMVRDQGSGGWLLVSVALVAMQGLSAAAVLGCALLEAMAGWRTLQGEPIPLRGPGLAGVLGSLLLVPTAMTGCSMCTFAFWPLPLGFALATAFLALRIPDPRLGGPQ